MDEAHYGAVRSRLETVFSGRVFDTARVDSDGRFVRDNYLVLFGGPAVEVLSDRFARADAAEDHTVFDYTVRAVGVSPGVVAGMLEDVRGLLRGWIPDVEGRRCRPVKFSGGSRLRADDGVKPPLYFADAEYELRSFKGAV